MNRTARMAIIFGSVAVAAAIGGALFYLYPEQLFRGTSLDSGNPDTSFSDNYMDETGDTLGGAPQVPSS